jgi:hypothetical protein
MRLKFFCTLLILSGICLSVHAQDTLKPSVITHRIDSSENKAPAKVQSNSIDTVSTGNSHTDTINVKKHSPLVAGLASAILPGAGQFYNKKYWKIPVLYAGIAVDIYFIASNLKSYNQYRQAYIANINGDSSTKNPYAFVYTAPELLSIQGYYQKYYDLSIIIGAAIYAINILDAVVDAHLFYFDVTEKLSMSVTPTVNPFHLGMLGTGGGTGLVLQLHF